MLLAAAMLVCAQESKPAAGSSAAEYKIPPEAAKLANPVKPTAASIAQGKKMYDIDCQVCHGKDGDGKGDGADRQREDKTPPRPLGCSLHHARPLGCTR